MDGHKLAELGKNLDKIHILRDEEMNSETKQTESDLSKTRILFGSSC